MNNKLEKMRILNEKIIGNCKMCPLHKNRSSIVFGAGNCYSKLMIIGEAPGFNEDMQGKPFIGLAGKLLKNIIEETPLKHKSIYVCNTVMCRPYKNRTPNISEIRECSRYLHLRIGIVKPKIILTLGKIATSLLKGKNIFITRVRGHIFTYKSIKVIPTFHPAYVLRKPEKKSFLQQDIKKAIMELKKLDT